MSIETEKQEQGEPMALKKGECWPEEVMRQWDYWRKEIANGHKGSAPRDWFEGLSEIKLIDTTPQKREWVGLTEEEYLSKAYRLANELQCHLAIAPAPQPQPQKRTWVELTDEEIDQGLLHSNYALQTARAWRDGVEWATKQLMERNT